MENIDKYIRLVRWAKARDASGNGGYVTLSIGWHPAWFKRLEEAAARKYLT